MNSRSRPEFGLLKRLTAVPLSLTKWMSVTAIENNDKRSFAVLESNRVTLVGPGGMGGILIAEPQPPRKKLETEKSKATEKAIALEWCRVCGAAELSDSYRSVHADSTEENKNLENMVPPLVSTVLHIGRLGGYRCVVPSENI
jgi:hypothetical protein